MTSDEIKGLRDNFYDATVSEIIQIHPELRIFRIRPDKGVEAYQPGQYTTLGLGLWEERTPGNPPEILKEGQEKKLLRRAYSLSHSILDANSGKLTDPPDFYEFYINKVTLESQEPTPPMLTCRLFNLKKGDRLACGPKVTGHYNLENVKANDNVLFFATGTGEAPHNAMIWKLLKEGHKGKIVHSVTTRKWEDQGYRNTHKKLESLYPNYKTLLLATREPEVKQKVYAQDLIEKGIVEEKAGIKIDPSAVHVFLCGNPALIGRPKEENGKRIYPMPKGMVEVLEKRGFTIHSAARPGNIHFEAYW